MHESPRNNRREFLLRAGAGMAASLAAVPAFGAAPAAEPMKIGVFGIDFTFWGIWAELMSPQGPFATSSGLRMRPAYVWDKNAQRAQTFARRWGCEVVERYDGMLGKVDAVVNGDLYNVPWQHLLLRPYLEAGVPCALSRHYSDTLAHMDEMLDLAAKGNAPILATVPYEHFAEADALAAKVKEIGEVQAAFGTCDATDEPHFHLSPMMLKVLGYDVEWVNLNTDDVKRFGYANLNFGYPRVERKRAFVASMSTSRPDAFNITVLGASGSATASMPASANQAARFGGQLVDMQKAFEKKAMYQPAEVIRKKYLALQAGFYSRLEKGGAPVKIGTVPADFKIPAWRDNYYDGTEFKK